MDREQFFAELRDALVQTRRAGAPARAARMSKTQLDLIHGNQPIDYSTGRPLLEGVPLLVDDSVPFGQFAIDR